PLPPDHKDDKGHYRAITQVALSRDVARVASASKDGTVRIGDVASGKVLLTFAGHRGDIDRSGEVHALALSEDGARAVSAGEDNLVLLWRTDTGAVEKEFRL